MLGVWNAMIKTPFHQYYAVFSITGDAQNGNKLTMESEPHLNISYNNIRTNGNRLKASYTDENSQRQELELDFTGDTFSGSLGIPHFGPVAFTGEKGKGIPMAERLKLYGDKSVQENRFWKGQWIWDVHQPEPDIGLQQLLVYFRRSFHIAEGLTPKLFVDVTADSRYRLYVNGRSVAVGPCKGDGQTQYYETVDVTQYLQTGENVLAVKVLRLSSHQPVVTGESGPLSIWRSNAAGLLVEASLRDEYGAVLESLHSGREWRTFRHSGYRFVRKSMIQWVGGVEEVDGSGGPTQDWMKPGFDDTTWSHALPFAGTREDFGLLSPWNLVARPIPFLYEEERTFVKVTKAEGIDPEQAEKLLKTGSEPILSVAPGQKMMMELDAGELTTGYLTIAVNGGQGSVIRLMGSEGYEALDSNEFQRKKGARDDISGKLIGEFDTYHVAGDSNSRSSEVYEPFWFRTFRFVRIEIEAGEVPMELASIKYRETGYPLEVKARFESSDEELNTLWDLSIRTLKRCMHETYEDCPFYEQLQYSMDSRLMMLFTYYVSADDRMPRRTIDDFYRSRQPSGLLQSRFPSVEPQVIPSFALYWVDMLAEHYDFNGDLELIKTYRPAIIELMDWFHDRLTDDGIVGVTSHRYWTYFDWVDAWPRGAPPESMERPMYLLSLMYAASLRKAAGLLTLTGWNDAANEMTSRADRVCEAVRRLAWSEERQLFRDLPGMEIYSQHSQIMAVLSDTVTGEEARQLLERAMEEPIHRVTLPFSYLLMQALKKTGLQHRTFDMWDRWRAFARQGLTTLPEVEVNPRSDCHAWSAVPLAEFPASILGITPAEPGFATVKIEPQIGKLKWAKGSVPTAHGMVEVEWALNGNNFELLAKVPDGVTAQVKLPDGSVRPFQGEGRFQTDGITI
ncbi:alpha-L-rhamnosidase C-terminal domain-containing protein [Paenibacillus prosopidis]|uniref:Alpha-L-rhamnosidase-like protein n=1 Tax=Paenibacillus prosopidis TaxID=630520 RepID=A0A368VSN3_9BACL|nr:alpha-L-rhamnosidase C-terminal domain-containing protein [Paenibacillus prosopidis]RCW43477.1 alpha-L-rhamnosidase-like protein [Paenibacillus prosopidis]